MSCTLVVDGSDVVVHLRRCVVTPPVCHCGHGPRPMGASRDAVARSQRVTSLLGACPAARVTRRVCRDNDIVIILLLLCYDTMVHHDESCPRAGLDRTQTLYAVVWHTLSLSAHLDDFVPNYRDDVPGAGPSVHLTPQSQCHFHDHDI